LLALLIEVLLVPFVLDKQLKEPLKERQAQLPEVLPLLDRQQLEVL